MVSIILDSPKIAANLGNIVRTCSLMQTNLYISGNVGFPFSSKKFQRASLDYGDNLRVVEYVEDITHFLQDPNRIWLFSSKGNLYLPEIKMHDDDFLFFGSETDGLPLELLKKYPDRVVQIPMELYNRCYNLANSVAIALYEYKRVKFIRKNQEAEK